MRGSPEEPLLRFVLLVVRKCLELRVGKRLAQGLQQRSDRRVGAQGDLVDLLVLFIDELAVGNDVRELLVIGEVLGVDQDALQVTIAFPDVVQFLAPVIDCEMNFALSVVTF